MNRRLYRLTPAGGKPNHYTDSYASMKGKLDGMPELSRVDYLEVDEALYIGEVLVARVA